MLSGGDVVEAMTNATADAIFFGGIFSFISAGVTSGIRLSRYYSKGARALRYAQKGDYDKIAKMFTHNKHSKKVMLGKWDGGGSTSYVVRAGHDYTYYQMPAQVWDDLYKKGVDMWKINQTFLDQQIAAGKQFYTSHIVKGFEDGWFGREIDYLFSYKLSDIQWIYNMRKLRVFIVYCKIIDGDLSLCDNIPYVKLGTESSNYNRNNLQLQKKVVGEHVDGIPTYKAF